jgi:putative SbcD/Mre11-related phosphoesterase
VSVAHDPVPDAPAILVDDVLAVADLHIGIEAELQESGVTLPSQTRKIATRLRDLVERTGARRLVLLGDVKHFIPGISPTERRDLPIFFNELYDVVDEIHIAAGNHDPLLRPYIGEVVTIHKPTGFRLGDAGFVHGHAWPSEEVMAAKVLLMGHNHPAVVFVDALGARHVQPCWVRVPFRKKHARYPALPREAIVVPAFNELCGGTPVNDARAKFLGPLVTDEVLRLDRARLHLLDGTDLGALPTLKVDARFRWQDYRQ